MMLHDGYSGPGGHPHPQYPPYSHPHHAHGYPPQPAGPPAQYHPFAPPGSGPGQPMGQPVPGPVDSYPSHAPPSGSLDGSAPPLASAPAAPPAPVVVDVTRLLRPPHRSSRPAKLLLVLRGLPGSGKSTLARKIREAELEAGAEAPRLHSLDDYYMQEVEVEVVEEEGGRKKRRKVTELKYVYEPEMEATYFRDLVRSVSRSCEDRRHSFVVVDAPVLRAEQLRELTAAGQRANFECYVLRPLEADPGVCASAGRNVHGHSLEALREMAVGFEEAPPLYTQVSAVSLFGGPVVGEEQEPAGAGSGSGAGKRPRGGSDIQEVEMEGDDDEDDEPGSGDGGDDPDAAAPRRRPISRWDDIADDGGGGEDGGGESFRDSLRRKKKAKTKAAKAAVAFASGAAGTDKPPDTDHEAVGSSRRPPSMFRRGSTPLKSALRRTPSRTASLGADGADNTGTGGSDATPSRTADAGASVSACDGAANSARRRVWWPDHGLEDDGCSEAATAGPGPRSAVAAAAAGLLRRSSAPAGLLAETVYLEGLGPPAELEDLPYGYQRRSSPAAGAGSAVAGGAHQHFLDQAKAEHESEHDLFRRLLLGKQAGGGAGGSTGGASCGSGSGTPLGLFESAPDEDNA
ncbi:hypothetical protein GPECTOR_49g503 [Gonium pectorale]|uniref:YLP motif-containing protein 1 n=1 Tax=Gonium pectorale TaxID=33097 RepID=A0A150G7T6_GONPE|nr:hypothetical protein GPECTOR_49g503 [Gonium pectorale]|eukprot:KXZ45919.1 hypothetical protein GPECTOR_49g503 [Gonium pectorale]